VLEFRGSAGRPAVSGKVSPRQSNRSGTAWPIMYQSRSSSLIEVLERVRSSTVFTITAQ